MLSPRFLLALLLACGLHAHPMGNFSVSHYSRLELKKDGVKLTYVLDLAEIPTFELFADWGVSHPDAGAVDRQAEGQARLWIKNLAFSVGGSSAAVALKSAKATISDGAGGMPVLRVAMEADVNAGPGELIYEDRNYSNRTGWKEIVIQKSQDVRLRSASNGDRDLSQGLTVYPPDLALAPPQDLRAMVSWDASPVTFIKPTTFLKPTELVKPTGPAVADLHFHPANQPVSHPVLAARGTAPLVTQPQRHAVVASFAQSQPTALGTVNRGDFLSRMMREKRFGFGAILIGFFVAFGLGALHALSPGHGKTIVAAYLVGSRGTLRHALFLGSMVTFTHTVSVFLLGLGVLFFQRYVVPDQIIPVLGSVSGCSIVCIGLWLLYQRSKALLAVAPAHSQALELDQRADAEAQPEPVEAFGFAGVAAHTHGFAHEHSHGGHGHDGEHYDHHQHAHDGHGHANDHGDHVHEGHQAVTPVKEDGRSVGLGQAFRPVPGLGISNPQFHTAHAVGYDLSPFGLDATAKGRVIGQDGAHDHTHEHGHHIHDGHQQAHHHAQDHGQAHTHDHAHHIHDGHQHHNHDHAHAHHDHDHGEGHDHHNHSGGFVHTHTHDGRTHSHEMPTSRITLGSLIALGASGGLVPCPSALILLLSAIALGHVALGLFLLVGFSAGLALVLMAIGALVLYARHLLPKSESANQHPAFRLVPVFSAVVVIVLGLLMTLTAAGVIQPVRFLGS